MTVTIEIQGLAALEKKLGRIAARDALMPAMRRSCERIRTGLVKYPPVPSEGDKARARALWTPKQRRFVMWAIRSGRIEVPYRRTGKLGQAWSTKIQQVASGIIGIVGNAMSSYNRFVQDADKQASIHQGRWTTAQQVVKEQRDRIVKDFQDEIARLCK